MPRLLTVICFCLPCALLLWQWQQVFSQAARYVPQQIRLQLGLNQSTTLGQLELAAPQADRQHLRVRRDAQGRWWGSNLSESKAIFWQGAQQNNLLLQTEMRLMLAGQSLGIKQINGLLVLKEEGGRTWQFDGRHLSMLGGAALPACPDVSRIRKITRWLHHLSPIEWSRDLQIGGSVACDQRLPWRGVAPQAIKVSKTEEGYRLSAASASTRSQLCANLSNALPCNTERSLQAQEFALGQGGVLFLGRSQYQVDFADDSMRLKAMRRVKWFLQPGATPELMFADGAESAEVAEGAARLHWHWQTLTPWQWPFALPISVVLAASLAVLGASCLLLARLLPRMPLRQVLSTGAWLAVLLLATLGYLLGRNSLGYGWLVLLYSLALCLTALSFLPQHASHASHCGWQRIGFGVALSLIGLGLVNQQALGILAIDSSGMRFFISTCCLACICLALLGLLRGAASLSLNSGQAEALLLGVALLALLAMLLEVLIGDEAGLGALQPIELAKTALILLAAHTFTLRSMQAGPIASIARRGWRLYFLQRCQGWWPYLKPLTLFIAILLLALMSVRDFSPLLLLGGWLWGMALAWGWAHRRTGVMVMCVLLAVGAVFAVQSVYHGDLPAAFAQVLWSERIAVWRAPELHPFSGMQFLRAFALMQQSQLDSSALALAWSVPEIQNDFSASFLVARFGFAGLQCAMLLQGLQLLCLLQLAARSLQQSHCGDFRLQWLAQWRFFALCGFASVLAAHFVLAWCCNFGWLPVMGQPMPFLSNAGSNMLLFIFPMLVLVQK